MSNRRLALGLAFLMTAAFGGPTLASDSVPARQSEMSSTLRAMNFDITGERVILTDRGRRDLVMFSKSSQDSVVRDLQRAYTTRATLPNGYQVTGWAHIAATDSFTFTLQRVNNTDRHVAEVARDGAGAKIALWGTVTRIDAPRKPLHTVPRRYVVPAGDSVTR